MHKRIHFPRGGGAIVDVCTEKMARVLVDYCTEVKERNKVLIQGTTLAIPLVEALYKETIRKGAYPEVYLLSENMQDIFFAYAEDHQLEYASPFLKHQMENVDVFIMIMAEYNPKHLSTVDPQRIARRTRAQQVFNAIMMKRAQEGTLRWTLTVYPTHAYAQEASMSLLEYQDFVYHACFVDVPDPIAEWRKLSKTQERIVNYLNGKSELHIVGEDTDLRVEMKGRKWINDDGHRNFPSGEAFTSPVEDSAEGTIRFTYPGIYMGKEVEDITLTLKEGVVVRASARKGDDLLHEMLAIDEGARRLGEVAIGANYGIATFTKNIVFDEKIGGTVHVALGRSIPEAGGRNTSAIHWDLLKNMESGGRLYADGELFYKNGKILI